jgi:hypothetical protein
MTQITLAHLGSELWEARLHSAGAMSMRKLLLLVIASLMLVGGLYVALFGHRFFVAAVVTALRMQAATMTA